MGKRLSASMRTREEFSSLIEGRLSTASAKDELIKLATRLIMEEALEGEARDATRRRRRNPVTLRRRSMSPNGMDRLLPPAG